MSAAIHAIRMPKFGLSMTEGKVAGWVVELGQAVSMGGDLVEIETEKITNVYESPVAGILRRQLVELDTLLPVGAVIGVVADATVSEAEIEAYVASTASLAGDPDDGAAASQIRARTAQIAGQTLRWLEAGTGAPLVMLHGFSGDAESWQFNQAALAETFHVIAPDLPGHGGSGKAVGDGSVATLAASVAALLQEISLGPVHLVGHSLGGAVALALAQSRPDLVASLSLIAPAGLAGEVSGDFVAAVLAADRPRPMKAALSQLFADPATVTTAMAENALRAKRLDGAFDALTQIAAANFAGQLTKTMPAALAAVQAADIVVQLIWGDQDRVLPPLSPEDTKAQLTLLQGAGHMPQMEQSARVNRLIEALIAQRA